MKRPALLVLGLLVACAAEAEPTKARYTIRFPSLAAAVATEQLQVLLFDVPEGGAATACAELFAARRRREIFDPVRSTAPGAVCDVFRSTRPLDVPFGEKAIFVIAQRGQEDFLLGCATQTFGDGDAPVPVSLGLVDVSNPVPATTCVSLGEFCDGACS